ncbi:MAG: DUF4293 family protein [Bacteroidetes bacterium]|nr:DUF4293 family protein [Bacteroidota bacterium]
MIQRIQSAYLLVVLIGSLFLVFTDTVYFESGDEPASHVTVDFNSTDNSQEHFENTRLMYWLYAIAAVALISIFMFRNRGFQTKLVMAIIALWVVVYVFMYSYSLGKGYFDHEQSEHFTFNALIPLALLILSVLALRNIRKDEALVRSVDRFR